ncbi:hypothetical protein Fmac_010346 [Flemingia macrophylla]|uniref:Uncharacterized protein n=1 Tax=Flemingia macrophylla TaxID=520843 RepID=A0ABD1MLI2_9FABA
MSMFDPGRRKQFLSILKEIDALRHAINTTFKNTCLHIIPELKIPGETNVSLTKPGLKKSTEKENSSIIPPDEAQDISEDIKQKSIAVASLGKSDIPNEDLDFDPKTTFSDPESDEDAKEECFFGILKEWSSGPSISRRALESDSGSHKTELEAKLSSFRELAYSDNFAVALSQPNFKTKIETTIEDLKSVNDMPAEIQSELKEFVLVFNKAFDLHLKNFLVRESIEKIENDTAEDREKLAVVRTQVTSLKQSIKQIGPSLEKFKKQEQDFLMTIEALQRKLSTNQAMQKNIQDEKNTMNKKHADLIDQARAISESLQEQLESKRKLEKDHSFLLTSLQQEVKHHQELKEKYFH